MLINGLPQRVLIQSLIPYKTAPKQETMFESDLALIWELFQKGKERRKA